MKVTIVNSFVSKGMTGKPMTGNPAGVAILDSFPAEEVMQSIAKKMGLSETAFVCPCGDGDSHSNDYNIRWFTPTCEVELCGHATLASAYIMLKEGIVKEGSDIVFRTAKHTLKATSKDGYIWLDFPVDILKPVKLSSKEARDVISVLGLDDSEIKYIGMGHSDYLIELQNEESVVNFLPAMESLSEIDIRGFIITASGDDYDFVSRFFAPAFGINEDPVTGSAHTTLCPYWSEKLNKTEMVGCQLSDRGGVVKVVLDGSRVRLGGKAETVATKEV